MTDLLALTDFTPAKLAELFALTQKLKGSAPVGPLFPDADVRLSPEPATAKPLKGKSLALLFEKPSLRTRVSFEVGIYQLGGHSVVLTDQEVGLGNREKARDVARVLSRFCNGIVARLFDHAELEELAEYATIPVINALTDKSHPCQVLADAFTLYERGRLGGPEAVRPKVAFIGDGNNMVHSWLEMAMLVPLDFVLAAPRGYEPDPGILRAAQLAGVSTIEVTTDVVAAATGADVLYTDVWTSMGQEEEQAERLADFAGYQVNADLLRLANPDALVMHCLPAHRGEEITDEVLEGPQSVVFDEAENRLHVQKAVLATLLGG